MMGKKRLNLTYAIKNGKIISIAEVEHGLKCGCVCPACGEPLIAKKGTKMMHHFAHRSGQNCEYGYESSLHLAAKDIISKSRKILIPPVYINFPSSYKKDELISEAKTIDVEHVELEKRYEGVIPDIVVYSGGKQFFIEIYVTHRIDDEKLLKLQNANISTIEIDLSKEVRTLTEKELKDILLCDSEKKSWKYNSVADIQLKRFYQAADKREIVSRGFAMQVDNCPIKTRMWRGKPYANFTDDCLYCKYCISHSFEGEMLCSGRLRIANVHDFSLPVSIRITESNNEIEDMKETAFAAGTCPNCGGKLTERHSKYGMFWGCSNYPHCRFTASPDPTTGEVKTRS